MSSKDYQFAEFTSMNMFEMRLTGVIPDFGYISYKKRKAFFDFCIEHCFLRNKKRKYRNVHLCDVLIDFRFTGMLAYGPKPIIFITDNIIVVQPSFKMYNII